MGWPRKTVWVRHGESEGNVLTADQRAEYDMSTDRYALTAQGRRQAEITGAYLRQKFPRGFAAYYISYYVRSRETMQIMFPDVKHYEDPRLAEANRGIWHVLTADQIRERFPVEVLRKEREGLYHYRPLGGENWPDIELRIHSFLTTLSRDYEGQDVVIVGHGHWFTLMQRLVHRFSIEEAMRRYRAGWFENTSVTVYEGVMVGGKSRLVLKEENVVPWRGKL